MNSPTTDEARLLALADGMEERAMRYAGDLFNCNMVYMPDDVHEHKRNVAYAANLFTVAAALRALTKGTDTP